MLDNQKLAEFNLVQHRKDGGIYIYHDVCQEGRSFYYPDLKRIYKYVKHHLSHCSGEDSDDANV